MDTLIVYNLCSVLSAISVLLTWSKLNYQFHWLYLYLGSNLIFCIVLHRIILSRNLSHLKKTFINSCIHLSTTIPTFFVIIFILGTSTASLINVLNHSIVLALLTSYPRAYLRYDLLLTEKDSKNKPTFEDKFALINLVVVIALSWFTSLSYYLDSKSESNIYPVASCLGAVTGSLIANLSSVVFYLFQHCNTLWVY